MDVYSCYICTYVCILLDAYIDMYNCMYIQRDAVVDGLPVEEHRTASLLGGSARPGCELGLPEPRRDGCGAFLNPEPLNRHERGSFKRGLGLLESGLGLMSGRFRVDMIIFGCFYKLRALIGDVPVLRALLFGAYIGS